MIFDFTHIMIFTVWIIMIYMIIENVTCDLLHNTCPYELPASFRHLNVFTRIQIPEVEPRLNVFDI